MTVIKNGPMPMYIQIADTIKQDIAQQKMKPGESIGSQRELIEKFGVSQVTVRQALNILEKEGLVVRKQGKGTFVKPVKVEQNLVNLQSLSHIIKESGFKPEVAVTKMETVAIPDNLKQLFNSNFSECLYIERVHVVKNKPIAFAKIYLPYYLKDTMTKEELECNTIYDLLENKLGLELGEAEQKIEACKAEGELAKYLGVTRGEPLLKAERIVYSKEQRPVEHITFFYRYDEYSFRIKLKRAPETTMWPG